MRFFLLFPQRVNAGSGKWISHKWRMQCPVHHLPCFHSHWWHQPSNVTKYFQGFYSVVSGGLDVGDVNVLCALGFPRVCKSSPKIVLGVEWRTLFSTVMCDTLWLSLILLLREIAVILYLYIFLLCLSPSHIYMIDHHWVW